MSFLMAVFLCECLVSLASLSLFYFIPITPVLLTAYACNQLASLEFMVAAILSSGKKSGSPQSLVLPSLSFKFLVASFVLSSVAVCLDANGVRVFSVTVLIILNVLLQAFYLIRAVIVIFGVSHVSKVEEKASVQLRAFDQLLGEARQCYACVSDDAQKKQLKRICEAIQYSDPVGHAETAEDENKIKGLLDELRKVAIAENGDVEGISKKLLQSIQIRNDKLRALKMGGR